MAAAVLIMRAEVLCVHAADACGVENGTLSLSLPHWGTGAWGTGHHRAA